MQTKLGEHDLWKGPWGRTKEALRGGQSICERWVQACETLTSQYWKSYGPHPWKDDKFVPANLGKLGERLEEVRSSLLWLVHIHYDGYGYGGPLPGEIPQIVLWRQLYHAESLHCTETETDLCP